MTPSRFSKITCGHTIFHSECSKCLLIQEEAYALLAEEGFQDIESSNAGRLLKSWAKSFYRSHRNRIQVLASGFPQGIFESEEFFLQNPDFQMVCESVCFHWNRKLKPENVLTIWTFHCEGLSGRKIAKKFSTSEGTVRRILKQIKDWKDLL